MSYPVAQIHFLLRGRPHEISSENSQAMRSGANEGGLRAQVFAGSAEKLTPMRRSTFAGFPSRESRAQHRCASGGQRPPASFVNVRVRQKPVPASLQEMEDQPFKPVKK